MYKFAVIDLDGTLLDSNSKLTEYTKEVLAKLKNKRVKIILASGRPYQSIILFAEELNLTGPFIANNGALVKSPTEGTLAREFIPKKIAAEILDYARKKNLYTSFYSPEGIYVERLTDKADVHIEEEQVLPERVKDLRSVLDQELISILFNVNSERTEQVTANLKQQFGEELAIVQTTDNYIDIMAKGVSKGKALLNLLKKYQLSTEEVIAFGDNNNDLSMLEVAGCGVAMGNSGEKIKETANKVALSNDDNGVAKMLEGIFG